MGHGRLFATIVMSIALLFVGCGDDQAAQATHALIVQFPAIEALAASSYRADSGCTLLVYWRGAFSTDPGSPACQSPTGATMSPFDEQAKIDATGLAQAFADAGVQVDSFEVDLDTQGHVGPGSRFLTAGCLTYVYEPGYDFPDPGPGEAARDLIDPSWYRIHACE
jgi:hypothetical protein